MSPLSLRRMLRGSRRRLAVLFVLVGLAGAVGVHHGVPMDMHAMPGQAICLAVLGGALLLVAGVALTGASGRLPRPTSLATPSALIVPSPRSAPARADPLYLRLAVLRL